MKSIRLILLVVAAALFPAIHTAAAEPAPDTADPWELIKDFTYQQRVDFTAGTGRLVEKLDEEIRQLNVKRASLPETSIKEWDFAMKEVKEAQAYLKFTISSLSDATPETWSQAKDKVAKAWTRAKDGCDKVKASTTT